MVSFLFFFFPLCVFLLISSLTLSCSLVKKPDEDVREVSRFFSPTIVLDLSFFRDSRALALLCLLPRPEMVKKTKSR